MKLENHLKGVDRMNSNYITKVYLLDVPLESDYKNTLYFTDKASQQSYFASRKVREYTDFSYQRKDQIIRVPDIYDNIYHCNYVMYQNSNYNNKWFYAFIKNLKYINDGTTEIEIETDVIQTWLFDYDVKTSFVEREHVDNDTIGANTYPEGLETGEYKINAHTIDTNMDELLSDLCYVVGSTTFPNSSTAKDSPAGSGVYNGIYSGVKYFQYESTSAIDIVLELMANAGKTDSITGIFMAPKVLAPLGSEIDDQGINQRVVQQSTTAYSYNLSINKNYGLGGYNPRNNKLKTYPYCYLMASNNQGQNAVYHYEDFNTSSCNFVVKGALTPGCSVRMTPTSYRGAAESDEYSINLGKFPICNFSNDMYTNWLTQNGISIGGVTLNAEQLGYAGAGVQFGFGVANLLAGNVLGAVGGTLGGVGSMLDTMKETYRHSLTPPQAQGNLNAGDVITASSRNNFHFYNMSIKSEYARIIDGFFDMFGYKVNRVKVPNKAHRSRYWYTKTIDVNIDGNIPNDDMQRIKDAYNRGITFWRNANEIENYSLSNNIV